MPTEGRPEYGEGDLVKAGWARNQAEAELIQGMLAEQGIPSVLRRTRGFDVPDSLAAGPRDVMVARGALEDTWAYLQDREQFGRPIAEFQALRFALADMAAEVAQARAFWQQVAHFVGSGRDGGE